MNATSASYEGYRLHSAFQPIMSLRHRRSVGFESLVRPIDRDEQPYSPDDLMRSASESGDMRRLDALCQDLHIRNFSTQAPDARWLFLNLDPSTITDGWYRDGTLVEALVEAGMPPQKIVIEIVEGAIEDEPLLSAAVDYYRSIGTLIALDDFGSGHSNFDRIWRLSPDIIKLDRSLIIEAEQHRSGRLRQMLPNLVSLIHEAGSLVIAEGIETREQALLAIESDVDFVQGFFFAYPSPTIDSHSLDESPALEAITQHFVTVATLAEQFEADRLVPYTAEFRSVVELIGQGEDPRAAIRRLMTMPHTARFYILDTRGEQIMHAHGGALHASRANARAAPISDPEGGTWYRRQYFQRAVAQPNRLQTSRPYLSSVGAHMCVTLSIADSYPPERVICCDIDW